jgi:AcrR family transcriptional regulator
VVEMDGYKRRTEIKKDKIKRAAIELFTTYGIEKVSIAEIASKASVSPVTIYNYFGTKEELSKKVISDMLEEVWQERIEMIHSDLPFQKKIEKMIFETTDFVGIVNPDFLKEIMSNSPEMKKIVEDVYQKYEFVLLNFIAGGKKEGSINKEISDETIMFYFNILKEASGKIEVTGDKNKNQRLMKELVTLLFYGLSSKPE